MKYDPDQVLASLEKILAQSKADQTELVFTRTTRGLTRFMKNHIHQNLVQSTRELTIRTIDGKKIGTFSTDRLDDEGIEYAIRQAREIGTMQEDDPSFKSLPRGNSIIKDTKSLDPDTSLLTPAQRADMVGRIASNLKKNKIEGNGSLSTAINELSVINSRGIRSYAITTKAELNIVATKDIYTAYAYRVGNRVSEIEPDDITTEILPKLKRKHKVVEVDPAQYTVVLEPYAAGQLMAFLGYLGFGALPYLEKRSFMSKLKGRQVGVKGLTLIDDGYNPHTVRKPFDYEGVKREKVVLIDKGIAKDVVWDSRTAGRRRGARNTGHALPPGSTQGPIPLNLVIKPGRRDPESIISKVKKGLYVTRFHYCNVVEPVSTVFTGMTRDGTFFIEDGVITRPVVNLRFTQSILDAIKNITAIGNDGRLVGSILGPVYAPTLCIKNFTFTGKSN
jgi:predicted Zn-dependent protease